MNNISFRLVSFLLSLVALTVVSNTRSARAEVPNTELSVERSEPVVAANREVVTAVTPLATRESVEKHSSVSLESLKPTTASLQEVEPDATPGITNEPLKTHSTVSLDSPKPAVASLRKVAIAMTPVATSESLKKPSTISLESPKPNVPSLQEVGTTVIPVASNEPLENHSTVSVESAKPSAASVQAVKLAVTPVASNEPLENHSTVSVESPKPSAAPVQAVKLAVTPVASSEPMEKHSSVSLESQTSATEPVQTVEPAVTPATTVEPIAVNPTFTQIPEDMTGQANVQPTHLADSNNNQADSQNLHSQVKTNDQQVVSNVANAASPVAQPIPGTLATSAGLLTGSLQTSPQPKGSSHQADSTVAQTEINPGQATRGGRSYIGIGGNIGFGDTGLGSGAFAINSKIGLTRFLSVRPAILFGDDVNFLIPLTYDFIIESDDPFAPVPFAPFLGGGVVISTADGNNIGFLLTGGVDVPLSREFVANATLNVGFLEDSTDVGLMIGVGYTFPNFIR